jgi:hypothetical protein
MDFSKSAADILQKVHCDYDGLQVVTDDWLSTAQKGGAFCWAAGDGVVNAVGLGHNAVLLFRQIRRLTLPNSLFILRHFIRPVPTPSTDEVLKRLAAGKIQSFSAFRHQMCISRQKSFMEAVPTSTVRDAILESGVLERDQGNGISWTAEQQAALDSYALEGVSLCYPTLAELQKITRIDFEVLDIAYGVYEMAELYPTIVYKTRNVADSKN